MSIDNVKIYGLPDLFALDSAVISAGSTASADFPATNMLTEVPSDTWRSIGYAPTKTLIRDIALVKGANYTPMTIGGLGLVNHNLWPWTGDVRFVLFSRASSTISDMFELLVPSSITASDNLDGAVVVGDIDNGFISTPGTKAGPSNNTLAWSISVALTNPTADLKAGAHLQTVWVLANSQADRLPSEALTVSATLLESGVDVGSSLGQKAVCSSAGQWLKFTFDTSELLAVSGANLGVRLNMTVDATLAAPAEYIEIDEIVVMVETVTSMSAVSGYIADSGWLPAGQFIGNPNGSGVYAAQYLPQELTRGDCIAWDTYSSDLAAREVYEVQTVAVIIREDHSPDQLLYDVATFPVPPPGYVEVGHVVGGGVVFTTEVNFAVGPLDGIKDLSVTKFTQGGSQFGTRNGILRTAAVDFPALTRAEKAFLMDRLLRRRGTSRPVLVSLTPGDELESEALTFYATISQQETAASTQLLEDYRRKLTLNFVEYR